MAKKKEAVVYFYNPNKTKWCKIVINSIENNNVEVSVTWKNTNDFDQLEVWYLAAEAYINNIK